VSLKPFGEGAVALLWKDVMLRYRMHGPRLLLMAAAPVLLVFSLRRFVDDPDIARTIPLVVVYVAWIMSMMIQGEARAELRHANILKSMPIAGWKAVLSQCVSYTIYIAVGTELLAASMWFLMPRVQGPELLAAALVVPFIVFGSVWTSILVGLLYPDSRDLAQNYVGVIVTGLIGFIPLVPTVTVSIAMILFTDYAPYLTAAAVCAANLILGAGGVALVGLVYRRFDPTSE